MDLQSYGFWGSFHSACVHSECVHLVAILDHLPMALGCKRIIKVPGINATDQAVCISQIASAGTISVARNILKKISSVV